MSSSEHPSLPAITDLLGSLTTLLLSTTGVQEYLQQVSQLACAVVQPPASCGITTRYDHRPITIASSDERARVIDQQQYEAGDGPCLHALRTGTVVEIADQDADDRWPAYRQAALAQGVAWLLSTPLTIDGTTAGAMNLYGYDQPHALAGAQRHNVEVFAAQASTALALAARLSTQQQVNAQLEQALDSRSVIDQAMGVLMTQRRCDAETAFALLRRQSQHGNTKLQVAADLIAAATGHPPATPTPFRLPLACQEAPMSTPSTPAQPRPEPPRPDPRGARAGEPGPGQTVGSVLGWVLARAAERHWSVLRPAEQLVALVHPDAPVLRQAVLARARARLHTGAGAQSRARERRAVATLTVALNLTEDHRPAHSPALAGLGPVDDADRHAPALGRLAEFLRPGCFPADREALVDVAVHHHATTGAAAAAEPARRPRLRRPGRGEARGPSPHAAEVTAVNRTAADSGDDDRDPAAVRVLLVEDDPSLHTPLARALRREGFTVHVATTGRGALAALAPTPDLVLLDVGLPDLNGLAVCRRIRARGNDVPVLMLTARAGELDPAVGGYAGADDYLTKPFRLTTLLERIHTLLTDHGTTPAGIAPAGTAPAGTRTDAADAAADHDAQVGDIAAMAAAILRRYHAGDDIGEILLDAISTAQDRLDARAQFDVLDDNAPSTWEATPLADYLALHRARRGP